MHSSQRRRGAAPKPQQHFNNWNEEESQLGLPTSSPTGELSPVTINFITPPVRCKVYQPMELRCNGVKVTPGPITAELQSFNPKTPKSHKAAAKLEDSGHRVLVKFHSMGSIHLRFPVAGLWSLSVEYEGVVYTKSIEVHGQRGKYAKLQSKLAADALHGGHLMDDGESEDSQEDALGGGPNGGDGTHPNRSMHSMRTRGGSREAAENQMHYFGGDRHHHAQGQASHLTHRQRHGLTSSTSSASSGVESPTSSTTSPGAPIGESSASIGVSTSWSPSASGIIKQEHHHQSGSSSQRSSHDWSSASGSGVSEATTNFASYLTFQGGNASVPHRSLNYPQLIYQHQQQQQQHQQMGQYPQQSQHYSQQHSGMTSSHGVHSFSSLSSGSSSQYSSPQQHSSQQPPFPLQPLSSMSIHPDKSDSGLLSFQSSWQQQQAYDGSSFMHGNGSSGPVPVFNSNNIQGGNSMDAYSQLSSSPSADMMLSSLGDSGIPESSTFAYNDMGQYGSASHMKQQEAEMNYIQPDAVYYPIPPACAYDVIESFFADSPSTPSVDSSTDGSSEGTMTPVVRSGYPFLSRIIPSSTNDVVSLGQECCLVGQNFVYTDSDANSIWFTLQANKAKVKAPVQHSTATTHVATIPPLSYFGISYAMEPLMAIVELYQYSLLVPCEQQFYYLSTPAQVSQVSKIKTEESQSGSHRQFGSNFGGANGSGSPTSGADRGTSGGSSDMGSDATGSGFMGSGSVYKSAGPSFFFNTGVPQLNTLTVDNNFEAIKELVAQGADANQPDLWGITPLHLAIFFGRKAIANFLLQTGVGKSVQTEDINGDTPLDLVIRHWDPEIRSLYDVMVSLLQDTATQIVSEGDGIARDMTSRRAASAGAASGLPKKPSFLSKKSAAAIVTTSLSSQLPFALEGDTLRVLKPEFWTQIHVALQQLADESSETDTLISEDQKRTLSQWQQISKAKNVISSDMNLTEFPAVPLMAFPLIECLDLSGNTIRFLPNDWSQFKSLSTLDVSRNLIDILPGSVAAHPTLKNFIFRDNPLRLLPPSLVSSLLPIDRPQAQQWIKAGKHGSGSGSAQQVSPSTHRRGKDSFPSSSSNTDDSKAFASTKAPLSLDTMAPSFDWTKTPVFKYLTEMSSGQEQMISDSKVRINVHGERYTDRRLLQNTLQVDFGSFVTRLRYKVPVIQPSDDITIQDFTNKFTPQDVSFETWTSGARHADFASQVLITPGIQLVLFSLLRPDARELEKVSYWLQAIAARAPTSPVILVACHCEALVSNSRDVTALMERVTSLATSTLSASCFDAHSDVVPVSFANGEGMDALKRRFADIVNRHALANKTYPKPLTQLVQTILMLKGARWFLSRRELSDLAMQFGIDVSHKESFASIVQQLSALGGLLYFGDANPRLADVVFTDPQRLCNALTNFAGRHKRLIKDGLLYMQDCDPNIVSILNGIPVLPESSSNSGQTVSSPSVSPTATIHSGPPSPQPVSKSSSGFGSSPVVEQTSPSSGKNPRSSSEPPVAATQSTGAIATSSSTPQSSENVEAVVRSSTRNSKGFLTSPIKPVAKSASSLSTTSPLIGRARIDDGVLVDILELFEEAVKLPNESVLLPRLLTDAVPEELLHQYWTQGLAHSFERVYQFSGAAIPKRLLNNFYRQIYEDQHLEVCLHWSQGVVLRYLGERAQITTPNPATIHIKVAGELPSRILTMVVSMMDDLISTFAPSLLAQVLIPCPSLSAASTTLRLNELLDALCDGESQITRGRTSIRLGLVAPDLCMQELQTLEAEESAFTTEAGLSVDSALEILESASTVSIVPSTSSSSAASTNTSAISSIGSASSDLVYALDGKTVWRGKLRGAEDVHVAYFHKSVQPAAFKTKEEFMEAASLSYLRGLTALCAEARLLNALQHPNMVRLKAFNMASQTLATEAPSHGTLRSFLGSSPSSFTPELKLRMMHELAQTVAWMHGNNVAHGALSPDSVLVTSLDVNPQHVHVKLCNLNQAVRTSTHPEAELKDKRDLATLFAQIWNGNLEGRPLDASSASSFSSTSASQSDEQQQMPQQFSSTTQLSLEISELISSCSSNLAGSHPIAIKEIIQHIEYLFAMQNWLLSVPLKLSMKNLSVSAHRYWKLENSIRIIDLNEREIASISSIVRASDGQVWIACASGYIHVWNNPGSGLQKDRNQPIKSVIQTYSIDTRQSRRRINALMPSGSYVWCITDGSICVYANDGQLVKSITHKQSLCITKYQSSSSLSSSSSSLPLRTNPGDGMVYIGGAHGEISVWDSSTMQCTLGVVLENRLPITAIAADSRYLWIGVGVSRRICHVVALNKQTLNEIFRFQAHDDLISSIVVVDDTHLWTSSFDGKINVWNITAENENKVGVRLEKSLMTHRRPILKMTSGPRNADHSTDRVYASDNSGIFIWDTKQHHLIHKHLVGRHRGAIGALESIDTGSFLSASVEDGCVCLWKQCHSMSQ